MSDLAILGGPKTRTEPYPQWPVWDQRDIDSVTEVIKSGRCFDFRNMKLPVAERACEHEAVWLDENIFRAGQKGVADAVAAIKKIQAHAEELDDAADELRKKYGR